MSTNTANFEHTSKDFRQQLWIPYLTRTFSWLVAKWSVILTLVAFAFNEFFYAGSAQLGAITVPQGLLERGYTGQVIAGQIADSYYRIEQETKSTIRRVDMKLGESPSVVTQSTDFTLLSVVESVLRFVHIPGAYAITGEVTQDDDRKFFLKLRINGHEVSQSLLGPFKRPEDMAEPAAEAILGVTQPYILAAREYNSGNRDAAETAAWQIINGTLPKADSNVFYAHILLGNIYDGKNKLAEELEQIGTALRTSPFSYVAQNNAGNFLRWRWHSNPLALIAFANVIGLDRNFALGHRNFGSTLRDLGVINLAKHELNVALRLDPHDDGAYNELGYLYAKIDDFGDAAAEYRAAIAINPTSQQTHMNLGLVYENRLHYHFAAMREYRAVLAINYNNEWAHNNLGVIYRNDLHNGAAAVKEYRIALGINPKNAVVHRNLGDAYENDLHDVPAAIAEYRIALSLDRDDDRTHQYLARACGKLKQVSCTAS